MMPERPEAVLVLADAAMVILIFLSLVRLRQIMILRLTELDRFRAAFPSWAASTFGLLAILSLGFIVPLDVVDALVGGSNNSNLLQSMLTIVAFWFFREAVREVAFEDPKRLSRWVLAILLLSFAIPFFLITDRGSASSAFMSAHADQLANVVYNVVYMGILAWIVSDMIWTLRREPRGAYSLFIVGLAIILVSTIDEVIYIVLAHVAPGPVSDGAYAAFYVLFFGGIVIVGSGWLWVLIVERDYRGQLLFRLWSMNLVCVLIGVRRRARKKLDRAGWVAAPPTPGDGQVAPQSTRSKLRVDHYRAGESEVRPTLAILAAESGLDALFGLAGANAEDVAYRLVVQIRNVVARHGVPLRAREARTVDLVESRFPGFDRDVVPV